MSTRKHHRPGLWKWQEDVISTCKRKGKFELPFYGQSRFFKGGDSSIKGMKREQLYVQLLESLHADEAELLVLSCNEDLQSKYRVTKQVVSDAFPKIEWGNRS